MNLSCSHNVLSRLASDVKEDDLVNITHLLEARFLFFSFEDNDAVFPDFDIPSEITP